MLGPIFTREATVVPKRPKTYLARAVYVLSLFLLLCTGYLVLDGSRSLGNSGDAARFGGWMFTLLAPLQLLVLSSIAAVGAASSVAQEKDRRTLILLLLTRLSGFEVVAGKMAATLLTPLSMLLCSLPLFLCLPLLGGVSPRQVMGVYAVTAASILLAASVGTLMGMWREKTFQAIALTVLGLLMYIGLGEIVSESVSTLPETAKLAISAPRALAAAASPMASLSNETAAGVLGFVIVTTGLALIVLAIGVIKVRVWNPSREVRMRAPEPESSDEALHASAPASWKVRAPRPVWDNPILWREVRTWAYGRKVLVIRVAFVLLFLLVAAVLYLQIQDGVAMESGGRIGRALPSVTLPLVAIGVISLVLVNALAVTSVTGERDGLAIDLLLVTDLSPAEFVFGKLLGVMYVAKEMILLPMVLVIYLAANGVLTIENTVYVILGSIILYVFVAMLGIHSGLNYVAGRSATLASLGTVFFLCVGIAVCMTIMVSFRGAFQLQLAPFLVMILGGGAALFAALGWRNPSSAIFMASFGLPLVTFYAITQFLLQTDHLYVFFAMLVGYCFTTAAMMIPALSEFDVSLERDRAAAGDAA
ncbi:ABC transporter permease [Rubripirellula reticaptiva]|uniref:ABC-2 family transporter protein n=1 Tax=Rubripirellula reticaptiva TaxID=2528013 RepID=A0A5C6FA52_9BACT|nr:ABC transporter permease [Rubripirellula reticaptiva]TWU57410.1 ABC-2 family transporter protein [Rubripirellula reticaptiva]